MGGPPGSRAVPGTSETYIAFESQDVRLAQQPS